MITQYKARLSLLGQEYADSICPDEEVDKQMKALSGAKNEARTRSGSCSHSRTDEAKSHIQLIKTTQPLNTLDFEIQLNDTEARFDGRRPSRLHSLHTMT